MNKLTCPVLLDAETKKSLIHCRKQLQSFPCERVFLLVDVITDLLDEQEEEEYHATGGLR
jgi:hypothetical protein